jgi:uncharacterized membrane protein
MEYTEKQIENAIQCLKKIGESLYTINKEAKKIRDAKRDLFDYQRGNIKYIPENLADLIGLKINEFRQIVVYDKDGQEYTSLDKIKDDIRDYESDIDANENRLNEIDNDLDDSDNEEDFDDLKKEKREIQEELDWQKDAVKNLESIKEEMEELNDSLEYGMSTLKEKESDLYELKNKILKLINPTAIEYHAFKNGDIRPLYKIGDFTFHGEDVSETYEGEVSKELEEISSENKMTDKINPKEAISYLEGLLKNPESLKKAIDVIIQKSVKNDITKHIESLEILKSAYEQGKIAKETFENYLEKAQRFYKDNAENKRLKRVGKPYGSNQQEDASKSSNLETKEKKDNKEPEKTVEEYAKESSNKALQTASQGGDEELRVAAKKELERRETEHKQEEALKPDKDKNSQDKEPEKPKEEAKDSENKKEVVLKEGDLSNIGIIQDVYKDQYKINGTWYHKRIVTPVDSSNKEFKEQAEVNEIISKLEEERGKGFITLYHGTDSKSYESIDKKGIFGKDETISFLTSNKKEAKEYSVNKAKYRGVNSGNVLEMTIPKWSVQRNRATGEYETELTFENKNGKWYPTNKSILSAFKSKDITKSNESQEQDIKKAIETLELAFIRGQISKEQFEKSMNNHKYIKKIPNGKGGFTYVYKEEEKKDSISTLENSIKEVFEKIVNLPHEHLYVFDKNGNVLFEVSQGKPDFIKIPEEYEKLLKGSISLHNHPKGNGFSLNDLQVCLFNQISKTMVCVKENGKFGEGIYYFENNLGKPFDLDSIEKDLEESYEIWFNETMESGKFDIKNGWIDVFKKTEIFKQNSDKLSFYFIDKHNNRRSL